MIGCRPIAAVLIAGWGVAASCGEPPLSLRDTVSPSALVDARSGAAVIAGRVTDAGCSNVLLRVTTSSGVTTQTRAAVHAQAFRSRYPDEFENAPPLQPGALFIDATTDDFNAARPGHYQAEATLIVYGRVALPALPFAFTCDLLDRSGRTDQACAEWPATRALVNLYMHSRAARIVHTGRPEFDLEKPADLQWFKDHLSLYEFDQRDRDWSQPLGHRVRRTFWQAVWNMWFNASNDHPLDGNPENRATTNFMPYAFANDFADLLVMAVVRQRAAQPGEDNLTELCREATENLLAMQHRGTNNFALPGQDGKRETYTAGAFRYGMFENGEYLTEGKGWFHNPNFGDYRHGGVLNGRAVWALGETLRQEPSGPLAPKLKEAIALALTFCLRDGQAGGYVKQTPQGHVYWRDAGEHAYLLLGLLAACEAGQRDLRKPCVDALDALADLEKPGHLWSRYPNVDSMAVAALAEGALLFQNEAGAARWRLVAGEVADAWMDARVDPKECAGPPVHFGLRSKPERMTYVWQERGHPQIFYYQSGHWIHALADLYALTGETRYRERAEAIVSDLCGNNPWQVRLFNELGGVYNWTDDTDGDGVQDLLKQDLYPESTAFCQIGILRLIQTITQRLR